MGRLNPEWKPWLELLDAARRAASEPFWSVAAPVVPAADRAADAPLLQGATIALPHRPARRWVRSLIRLAARQDTPGAASLARLKFRRLDVAALLEAAIALDPSAVEEIAKESGADANALAAVAQFAAFPLLQACGRRLEEHVVGDWSEGYCPICGAWPSLVEMRGIERTRRHRCGRCGADWAATVLRCPFCDERDHRKQGGLVPDGEEELRKVDTCHTCRSYMKAITTLGPIAPDAVLLEDLATVELDLAAIERGYARPDRPGYSVRVRAGGGGARVTSGESS